MFQKTAFPALLAGLAAGFLGLGGGSFPGVGPVQAPESLPSLVTGGGVILSSGEGGHQGEEPPVVSSGEAAEPDSEETPSFSEFSPSSQSVTPASSSQAPVSSSGSSSQVASSSSSAPPPAVSSSRPKPESEAEEEIEEEEDEEPEKDPPSAPADPRPSQPSSSSKPEPPSSSEPEPEVEPEPEPEPEEEDEPSGWQDLRVQSGGKTVNDSALSIVAQIVQNEMGSSYPDEAIKAQAVAAYTFVRYHNATGSTPAVGLRTATDRVTRLVKEVAGEQITYSGQPILASYCAMSAGWTASSQSVWGRSLPYLVPVDSDVDERESTFRKTTTIPQSTVKSKLESALGVTLDGLSPDDWLEIQSYWDDTGLYVNEVLVGGSVTTTGRKLRENIFGLRSAAFEVRYDPGAEAFDFITQGYGHGVGMSQVGAKHLANDGWDHVEILEHYYTGAQVTS